VSDIAARLARGAAQLGVALDATQQSKLLRLGEELLRWNKAYNLTAIRHPDEVLTHHLLDSLSVLPELTGTQIADVGTGAGFPGLPLAIVQPARRFTLIDAVDKKLRFIDHMARELGLSNVTTCHARVEQLQPAQSFDAVIARAFAPLPKLLELVDPLCNEATRVLAMVGRWPPAAEEARAAQAGAPPAPWRIVAQRRIEVPGLGAERHILTLMKSANPPRNS
jgi:16S rRNA (guanine527-N7)-methyltransferase